MTNGEKLKEVFPSIKLYEKSHDAIQINFDSVWWNAEYKEPTTKNDLGVDLISRADAIQAMQDKAKELKNEDTINGLCGAVAILFDMPSVTPIRPKGHWISHREHCENLGVVPSGLGAYEWCSNCDCGIDVREWHRNHYNYCPNCGADMSEVDE